jgi:ribosomal protein S27E
MNASQIQVVCAWCGKVLRESDVENPVISHSICEECKRNLEKEIQASMKEN